MNKMNIPGFCGEAALGQVRSIYQGRSKAFVGESRQVSMQLDNPRFPRPKFPKLRNWDGPTFDFPEPLSETCDTGAADCAKRCIEALNSNKAACAKLTDEAARQACYTDAISRASNCQTNCSNSFPPTFDCPPLGGF